MNKERRKELKLASALIEEARGILETAASNEREYFDNMPEHMQTSDKGSAAESAADALDSAIEACETAMESIDEATQ